ncbi:MAG: 16S rRNA (guanine(966)-N(2))-methyltransferase RsmD [Lachnospiraceae bacterium]|nr:16S rRNA (guanine(966)-N(2))-methyltransferase RsmD [Lachnospiraceae bacterium]
MRVIAGSARRLKLITPEGLHTRPTSDKIKETLFNIIQGDLPEAKFLDLFAGSGGIAIEALSRGASRAVIVDNNREAIRCITQNVKTTKFTEQAEIMSMDVFRALNQLILRGDGPFDIIFMDPPYYGGFEKKVLEILANSGLIDSDTLIIVETAEETDLDYLEDIGLEADRVKDYKNSKHTFVRMI